MAMNLRDYFQLRCSEMLIAERDILKMNQLMTQEVQHSRLKEMFQRHADPTKQQIENLERVVDRLGGPIGPSENPVTQGMMRAHQMFMETNPPQNLIDIHNALEGDKVEHLELVSYQGLIALAQQLGEQELVQLLQENRTGEDQMRSRLESDLPSLLSELGGHGRMAA
jgi:ferritin-like metal-binding protein YciE